MGFTVPHHGSVSSGGSPALGVSPAGVAPFGATAALPGFGSAAGALHRGLTNGQLL
jgi:hypothetical protein